MHILAHVITRAEYRTPDRSVIDGVPVFHLEGPGPLLAVLMFRVGLADETLPTRGITHVVEHLALDSAIDRPDRDRVGGRVDAMVTRFSVRGTPADVTQFLADVTSNLSDLPTQRLELERRVLLTEAANANFGSMKQVSSYRYGARGRGLEDFHEYGLRWLGAEALRSWAAERFNAGNAALWVSGELPKDLRLNLRPGTRFPAVRVEPLPHPTPATFREDNAGVLLHMLSDQGSLVETHVAALVLNARAWQRLRRTEGIAYQTWARYAPGGLEVFADSVRDDAAAVAGLMVAIARDVAAHGHTSQELDDMFVEIESDRELPNRFFDSLEEAALLEIGAVRSIMSDDDFEKAARQLEPADLGRFMEGALATAYLSIPEGVEGDIDGFTMLPHGNGIAFNGFLAVTSTGTEHQDVINVSDEGVSLSEADGTIRGFRWPDVAAALWWHDGTRALIGHDGYGFRMSPKNWSAPNSLIEAIQAHVPPDRWVPMDR